MDGLRTELEKAKSDAEAARFEAEKAKTVSTEQEKKIENLVSQITELEVSSKTTIDQKNDECNEMRAKLEVQSELVAKFKDESKDLSAAIERSKEDSDAMKVKIAELEKANSDQDAAVQKAKEDSKAVDGLRCDLEKAKSDVEAARIEKEKAMATIIEHEREVKDLKGHITELEMANKDALDKKDKEIEYEITKHENKITELEMKREEETKNLTLALERAKDNSKTMTDGILAELEQAKRDVELKTSEAENARATNAQYENKMTGLTEQIAELEIIGQQALNEKNEECLQLKSKLEEQSAHMNKLKEAAEDQAAEVARATEAFKSVELLKTELKKVKSETEASRSEAEKLRTAEKEEERQKLATALEGLKSERLESLEKEEEYESMLEMSSAIITTLQEEVEREKGAMEEAQKANEGLRERYGLIIIPHLYAQHLNIHSCSLLGSRT